MGKDGKPPYDFDRLNGELPGGLMDWFGDRDGYLILATDAETFGHHNHGHIENLLIPLIDHWGHGNEPIGIAPLQEIYDLYAPRSEERDVPSSTWSTEIHQYHAGIPYPLWDHPENRYHRALWKLVGVARRYGADPRASEDVLKVLSSCAWWQVAYHDGSHIKGDLMMHGARLAREIIERCGNEKDKDEGRRAFAELIKLPGVYE
jgi:hypothetical protein